MRSGPAVLVAASLIVVGLSAGCGKSAEQAPAPSVQNPPQPTEKGVIGGLPPRSFNQGGNAADGILALESEGYSVRINWGGGRQDQPLSMCRIGSVDGLRGSGAVQPGTSVYVTVIC